LKIKNSKEKNTMADKKMTKKEKFLALLEKYPFTDGEREFIEHEVELLDKKNAPKEGGKALTPAQKENEGIKQAILDFMTADGKKYTITDLIKQVPACNGMTNQKVSALVRQLLDALLVVRTEEKGKALFSVA
jgi:hypothetical protein